MNTLTFHSLRFVSALALSALVLPVAFAAPPGYVAPQPTFMDWQSPNHASISSQSSPPLTLGSVKWDSVQWTSLTNRSPGGSVSFRATSGTASNLAALIKQGNTRFDLQNYNRYSNQGSTNTLTGVTLTPMTIVGDPTYREYITLRYMGRTEVKYGGLIR